MTGAAKVPPAAAPRTARTVTLLVLVAAVAFVAALFWRSDDAPPPSPPVGGPERTDGEADALAVQLDQAVRARQPVTDSAASTADDAVGERTVRLRVVDARSTEPVAGVRVVDLATGKDFAVTDAGGLATVPSRPLSRWGLFAPGYLVRVPQPNDADAVAATSALADGQLATLRLEPDLFTARVTVQFLSPDGQPVAHDVQGRIECRDQPPPTSRSFPTARLAPGESVAPALLGAWQRHALMVMLPKLADDLLAGLHLGVQSDRRTHVFDGGRGDMRFVALGNYRMLAACPDAGLVLDAPFQVRADGQSLSLTMQPQQVIRGQVVGADGTGLAAAELVQLGDDRAPGSSRVVTAADGAFRLAPLLHPRVTVEVSHPNHRTRRVELQAGEPQTVTLEPLPAQTLRGVVTSRPPQRPIAAATVQLLRLGQVLASTATDERGRFELRTGFEDSAGLSLRVAADGFIARLEALSGEVLGDYSCELWPASVAARLAAGLTGVVEGQVVDARGEPVAGMPVQLFSETPRTPAGVPGRVVMQGGVLDLRPLAMSGEDGRFAIEWDVPGPAKVLPVDGVSGAEDGVAVSLQLGQRSPSVRVQAMTSR